MDKKLIASFIVFVFCLGGFLLLDFWKGVLWLMFLIAAYPLCISYTVAGELPANKLVEMYKLGLAQIPVIGKLFPADWRDRKERH